MNILYGLYRPDEGRCAIDGRPLELASPKDAIARGIGMIHQHFMLVNSLTVTENIVLGLGRGLGAVDLKAHEARVRQMSRDFGFDVDPGVEVWKLPMGMRQRVEILKALYRKAEVLILDEPTSVLAPGEIGFLPQRPQDAARRQSHDPLHHPQARRGDADCRPRHRHAPGKGYGRRRCGKNDAAASWRGAWSDVTW